VSAHVTVVRTTAAHVAQSTGRHRGDGNRPSSSQSGRSVAIATYPGAHNQEPSQVAQDAGGTSRVGVLVYAVWLVSFTTFKVTAFQEWEAIPFAVVPSPCCTAPRGARLYCAARRSARAYAG
jgi:hypothetical protein